MIMLLKAIKISELYGSYDYDVQFNDDVTFIYGMNGCGKTTVLNITEAIITGTVFRLFEYQFATIILRYSTNLNDVMKEIVICNKNNQLNILFEGESEDIIRLSISELMIENDYDDYVHAYFAKYSILKRIRSTFNHAITLEKLIIFSKTLSLNQRIPTGLLNS